MATQTDPVLHEQFEGFKSVTPVQSRRWFKTEQTELINSRHWEAQDFEEFTRLESILLTKRILALKRLGMPGRERAKHNTAMQYIRCRRTRDFLWLLNPTCGLCGKGFASKSEVTIDHIIPKYHKGKKEPSNKQLAHMRCNSAKGHQLIHQDWGNDMKPSSPDSPLRPSESPNNGED